MSDSWYYVFEGERKGPIEIAVIANLISDNKLNQEDYVWKKGFENWLKIKEVPELKVSPSMQASSDKTEPNLTLPVLDDESIALKQISMGENSIYVKIGADRGAGESEYGPFSLEMIQRLFTEKRINAKTFAFVKGMTNWRLLGDFSDFADVFHVAPPIIDEQDRRVFGRKPFIARMFVQSFDKVFEGICRDISVGGMQVLIDHFPGKAGDVIAINVHPENTDYNFVANGEVVRLLDGDQGFSFRFLDLDTVAQEAIKTYLADG